MAAERLADHDDDDIQVDCSDLERKYAVRMDMGLENFIVVDGTPIAPEGKVALLSKVLTKYFVQAGPISTDGLHVPTKDGKTLGFVFIEYETPKAAAEAIKQFNGKRFDTKHTFTVNKLSDIERFGGDETITDTYKEPKKTEFKPRSHLRSWLADPAGRDQFFAHINDSINVLWYKKTEDPKFVGKIDHVDSPAKWSPKGTYLATQYSFGVQLNGGPSLETVGQLLHYNVELIDFSPNEKYLVTFSNVPIGEAAENDPENPKVPFGEQDRGNQIVIWDTRTQLPLRTFRVPTNSNVNGGNQLVWPVFKWSSDSKYFARVTKDTLSIYETPSMSLVDKKSVSVPGISDFSFSPTSIVLRDRQHAAKARQAGDNDKAPKGDQVLCYWTPEIGNQAARVSIMTVPSKEVIRTRNLFNVADCRFHWQDDGKYLCVKVDRYTRNKKQTFTNLEFFRMTERDIPVEAIELKDRVINFAWEPHGSKFTIVSRQDVPGQQGPPGPNSNNLSFYGLAEKKKIVSDSWKLLKVFDKKPTTSIYWSPKGRFVATSNFGPQTSQPIIEYWDTEYEAEKREGIVENTSGVNNIGSYENYGIVDLQWDPSGRYTALWSIKGQSSYRILSFHGNVLHEKTVDNLRFVSWRPRPASLLSEEEKAKILKGLDKYSARFDEEDAMEADVATRELFTKRRNQISEWYEYREKMQVKLRGLKLVPEEELWKADGDEVVEEVREEIIEETIEVLSN